MPHDPQEIAARAAMANLTETKALIEEVKALRNDLQTGRFHNRLRNLSQCATVIALCIVLQTCTAFIPEGPQKVIIVPDPFQAMVDAPVRSAPAAIKGINQDTLRRQMEQPERR